MNTIQREFRISRAAQNRATTGYIYTTIDADARFPIRRMIN